MKRLYGKCVNNMVTGNVIFGGNNDNLVLVEYTKDCRVERHSRCLVYAEQLTTEIALWVIKKNIAGILTRQSSFATHGANILRAYFKNYKSNFTWITNIEKTDIIEYIGENVSIVNGKIYFQTEHINEGYVQNIEFIPIKNRTRAEYSIERKKLKLCYWPHRKYDKFTFSVMKKGLEKNCDWLFHKKVDVILDENGYIWFANGISLREITDLARDYTKSEWNLERQIQEYDQILKNIFPQISLTEILDLLIKYFSVFILYHNTYEQVLLDVYKCVKSIYDVNFAIECMDQILFCSIDEWMLNQSLILEKNKSLFANEPIVPIPEFSIYDDIRKKKENIRHFFKKNGKLPFYQEHKMQMDYWIKVFVTKEWKFVLNKILFTRCAHILRKFCDEKSISLQQIQNKTMDSVVNTVGDSNE